MTDGKSKKHNEFLSCFYLLIAATLPNAKLHGLEVIKIE